MNHFTCIDVAGKNYVNCSKKSKIIEFRCFNGNSNISYNACMLKTKYKVPIDGEKAAYTFIDNKVMFNNSKFEVKATFKDNDDISKIDKSICGDKLNLTADVVTLTDDRFTLGSNENIFNKVLYFKNKYVTVYQENINYIGEAFIMANNNDNIFDILNKNPRTLNNYVRINNMNGQILRRNAKNNTEIDDYFLNIISQKQMNNNTGRTNNPEIFNTIQANTKSLNFPITIYEEFLLINSKIDDDKINNIRFLKNQHFDSFRKSSNTKENFVKNIKSNMQFKNNSYLIATLNAVGHAGFVILARDDMYIFDSSNYFFNHYFNNAHLFQDENIFTNSYMRALQRGGNCGFWAAYGIEHYSKVPDLINLLASKNKTRYIDVENIQIACKMSDLFDTKRIGKPLLTENISAISAKNDYTNVLLPYFKSDTKNSKVYCKNVFVRKGFDEEDNYKFSDCINTFSLDKTLLTIRKDFTRRRLFNTSHSNFNSTAFDATIARNGLKVNSMTTKSDIETGIIYSYQKKAKTASPLILNQKEVKQYKKSEYNKFIKVNCKEGFEFFRNITTKICTVFIKIATQ